MRRTLSLITSAALALAMMTPATASQGRDDHSHRLPEAKTRSTSGELAPPNTPNPWVSFLPPTTKPDYATWNEYLRAGAADRAATAPRPGRSAVRFDESEPPDADGVNDTIATADFVDRFGTGEGDSNRAILRGSAPAPAAGSVLVITPTEEDGSFGTATETGAVPGDTAEASATIGDGAWGSAGAGTGDFDFYAVRNVASGDGIVIDVDTPIPFGDLDPFVAVFDAAGVPLAFNDDDGESFDSFLTFVAPSSGDYFVSVGGFGAFIPEDPTVPGSPSVGGSVGSEGDYDVSITHVAFDTDMFAFSAEAGDIIGATTSRNAPRITLFAADGTELIGSSQDLTFIHPAASRLPGGGLASLSYVIDTPGDYVLAVLATDDYRVDARMFRPAKERQGRASQKLFIDFDGGDLDPGIFFGAPFGFEVSLSPLSAFLANWGLSPADEDAVIDAILAVVEENLSSDLRAFGNNGDFDLTGHFGDFDIEILNSRDHADPWGDPFVSRIIVGGTINELGIPTIGIAQSIDVGDFESEESAVVLLDILSLTDPNDPNYSLSLNSFPIDPSSSIVELIGAAVGNIVAHEGGHFFANWHTDQFNPDANIMDQGGNLPGTIGVGPDGIWGTADDEDVDLGPDVYVPNEGFTGLEDTLQSISFGLSTGPRARRP